MSRMRNATLVVKKPGFLVPTQFLELVLPKTAAAGYAIQIPGENTLEFDTMTDRAPVVDEFNELQSAYKDNWGLFYLFDAAGQKFNVEDIQPFTLAVGNEGEEPRHLLAFSLEGDFPGYSQQNDHGDEYNLVDEILMPSLQKTYGFCTGKDGVVDLDKFFSELHDPVFNKTLLNTMAHRGAFAFLPLTGDAVMVGKNELGDTFEWGQTSQTHGYSETKAVSQEPEPVKKAGWWGKKAKAETPPVVPTPSVPQVPEKKAEPATPAVVNPNSVKPKIEAPKTETSSLGEGHYETIPANMTKKDKKKLIRKMMGLNPSDQLPVGWDKNDFKVWVRGPAPEKPPVKDLKELKTAMDNKVVDLKPKTEVKTTPVQAKAEAVMSQTLSAQEKSNLEGFILKYLDTQSQVVPNPKDVQKVEDKYPSFTEAGGIKITDTLLWPTDTVVALFKSHPKAAMLWALELRRTLLPHYKMEDLIPSKKEPEPAPVVEVEEKKVVNGKLGGSFWGRRK